MKNYQNYPIENKMVTAYNNKVQREHHRTSPEIQQQLIFLLFKRKKSEGNVCQVKNKVDEVTRKFPHEK